MEMPQDELCFRGELYQRGPCFGRIRGEGGREREREGGV